MTLPDGEQTLKVRDPTGAVLGFIVPEKHMRELLSGGEALLTELNALRDEKAGLEEKNTEAGRQLDEAKEVVSNFEKMWEAWNKYGVIPLRECEIERARESGIEGRELIAEIEHLLYPTSAGEPS